MAHADELVLEGAQGTFKSSVFAVLGGEWYTNDIAALGHFCLPVFSAVQLLQLLGLYNVSVSMQQH